MKRSETGKALTRAGRRAAAWGGMGNGGLRGVRRSRLTGIVIANATKNGTLKMYSSLSLWSTLSFFAWNDAM